MAPASVAPFDEEMIRVNRDDEEAAPGLAKEIAGQCLADEIPGPAVHHVQGHVAAGPLALDLHLDEPRRVPHRIRENLCVDDVETNDRVLALVQLECPP